jgi:hypothetical protein
MSCGLIDNDYIFYVTDTYTVNQHANGLFFIEVWSVRVEDKAMALKQKWMMGHKNPFDAYFYLLENFKEEEIV